MKKIEDLQKVIEEENPPLQAILAVIIAELNDVKKFVGMPEKSADDVLMEAAAEIKAEPVKKSVFASLLNKLNPFA